jgi:tRNA (guanine37-N1)-methyltransferase
MRLDLVTIFPRMFDSPFSETIIKRAREKGVVEIFIHDIRAFAKDKHKMVDDTPYGGGAGMVMMPGPLVECVESIDRLSSSLRVVLAPSGEPFSEAIAREFAALDQLILICGRYEGIDERAKEIIADREISIGDYVLSGGEIPAMAVADAVIRLIPGVLGNNTSVEHESFENGLLEHPHYTRPEIFRGMKVPEVLLSGNHSEIDKWRHSEALRLTLERRPDMAGRFADPVNDVKNKKCPKPKIETK